MRRVVLKVHASRCGFQLARVGKCQCRRRDKYGEWRETSGMNLIHAKDLQKYGERRKIMNCLIKWSTALVTG